MAGATAHMTGHFIYAHAKSDIIMYLGATAAALGPCVAPLIRSMTSKLLAPAERGKRIVKKNRLRANRMNFPFGWIIVGQPDV